MAHLPADRFADGYPTLLILDANGRKIARQPGFLPPSQVASWLDSHAKQR
jgi:thioredoxin-related protein